MIEVGAPEFVEKIQLWWNKKMGFLLACLASWGIFATAVEKSDQHGFFVTYFYEVLILIWMGVFLIWFVTTNRLVFRNGCDLVIAFMIEIDDQSEVQNLQLIANNIIVRNKSSKSLKNVKFITLPTNFLKQNEIKNYVSRNCKSIDTFVVLHVNSGNVNGDLKTEIFRFEFICNFENIPYERTILKNKINFIKEIQIQNFHKKWAILNSNSFDDRVILKNNFEDLLQHLVAIQFVLKGKFEKALEIIERITDIEKTKIEIKESSNSVIKVKPDFFSQSRLLNLLISLYVAVSEIYMYEDSQRTLIVLQRLEKLFPNQIHEYSFTLYIRMARMYYECSDLQNAFLYTEKAEKLNPKEPSININRLFFGVINKDWAIIHKNLQQIWHRRKKIESVISEIVDFLIKEKKQFPGNTLMFDYVIAAYEIMFLDRNEGIKGMREVLEIMKEEGVPQNVLHLGYKIINAPN